MTPVKRLNDILQDALILIADFEQQYRDVQTRFVCYRKAQPVYQSGPLSRHHLQTELPQICRTHGATKLRLIITGCDHRRETIPLYDETFRLARAGQSGLTSGGYGLGSPMPQPALSGMSHGGLGAAETAALVNKRVNDELLLKAHADLQKEAGDMRYKIAKLETELEEQVEVNKSRNMVKEYTGMITPFIPALGSLLGIDMESGKSAPAGLGSIEAAATAPQNGNEAQDSEQTKMVIGLVRQFMTGLGEVHRQQLLSVMLRIRQDHSLITHMARFINKPHQPQQHQQQGDVLKPEQAHDEQQQQ